MSYKICFSITCHECPECVEDQFEKFAILAPNSCAVFHLGVVNGEEFKNKVINLLSKYPQAYINPTQYDQCWADGRIVNSHISNFNYALDNFDFEYFWLDSSNSLLVNKGAEDHVGKFDYGANISEINESCEWPWADKAREDEELIKLIHKFGPGAKIFAGQHEGLFAKKEIFNDIFGRISEFFPFNATNYPREETFIQSCIGNLYMTNLKKSKAGCLMWAGHDAIQSAIDRNYDWLDANGVYSIKRIPRNINNIVRKSISNSIRAETTAVIQN